MYAVTELGLTTTITYNCIVLFPCIRFMVHCFNAHACMHSMLATSIVIKRCTWKWTDSDVPWGHPNVLTKLDYNSISSVKPGTSVLFTIHISLSILMDPNIVQLYTFNSCGLNSAILDVLILTFNDSIVALSIVQFSRMHAFHGTVL